MHYFLFVLAGHSHKYKPFSIYESHVSFQSIKSVEHIGSNEMTWVHVSFVLSKKKGCVWFPISEAIPGWMRRCIRCKCSVQHEISIVGVTII